MALGKIRRWTCRKSEDGFICGFQRWTVIFFHDFNKAVSGFRSCLSRESLVQPQVVARRQTPVAVRIMGANAVDPPCVSLVVRRSNFPLFLRWAG